MTADSSRSTTAEQAVRFAVSTYGALLAFLPRDPADAERMLASLVAFDLEHSPAFAHSRRKRIRSPLLTTWSFMGVPGLGCHFQRIQKEWAKQLGPRRTDGRGVEAKFSGLAVLRAIAAMDIESLPFVTARAAAATAVALSSAAFRLVELVALGGRVGLSSAADTATDVAEPEWHDWRSLPPSAFTNAAAIHAEMTTKTSKGNVVRVSVVSYPTLGAANPVRILVRYLFRRDVQRLAASGATRWFPQRTGISVE